MRLFRLLWRSARARQTDQGALIVPSVDPIEGRKYPEVEHALSLMETSEDGCIFDARRGLRLEVADRKLYVTGTPQVLNEIERIFGGMRRKVLIRTGPDMLYFAVESLVR